MCGLGCLWDDISVTRVSNTKGATSGAGSDCPSYEFTLVFVGFLLLNPTVLNYLAFKYFESERTKWRLFQARVARTKFDTYVDTAAGGLLVYEDMIRPVVSVYDTIHGLVDLFIIEIYSS